MCLDIVIASILRISGSGYSANVVGGKKPNELFMNMFLLEKKYMNNGRINETSFVETVHLGLSNK